MSKGPTPIGGTWGHQIVMTKTDDRPLIAYRGSLMSFLTFPIVHLLPLWFGAALAEESFDLEPKVEPEVAEDERREVLFANVWAVPPTTFIAPR